MSPQHLRSLRTSLTLIGAGLAVQLSTALHWTPATFIISTTLGVPLVLLGTGRILATLWRALRAKGVL